MNISRGFLIIGCLYLIVGISFGIMMGGSGDTTMTPVHAHLNLLGFVLMSIFGLVYRSFPAMAHNMLARVHFWLHQAGVLVLLAMLFLLLSGRIAETAMVPIAPLAELAIMVGLLCFGFNLWRNGK